MAQPWQGSARRDTFLCCRHCIEYTTFGGADRAGSRHRGNDVVDTVTPLSRHVDHTNAARPRLWPWPSKRCGHSRAKGSGPALCRHYPWPDSLRTAAIADRAMADCSEHQADALGRLEQRRADGEIKAAMAPWRYPQGIPC